MIAYISGNLLEYTEERIVVEANGVGYELLCSANTIDDYIGRDQVKVLVYTHVREDQFTLFGFSQKMEKELFLLLLKVNGIGPKMALAALSGSSPDRIIEMIEDGDVKALTKLPKVGKKKAEQIVLTLKGKLVLSDEIAASPKTGKTKDILSALVNLGYKEADVANIVQELNPELSIEESIRKSLTILSGL